MSIDKLQDRIRKSKCPITVNFSVSPEHIPTHIMEMSDDFVQARQIFFSELLVGLQDLIPAVRFSFPSFAASGPKGLDSLSLLLNLAREYGYYILLDGMEALSAQEAEHIAKQFMVDDCLWAFDGLIIPAYIGSDGIKPYLSRMKDTGKDLFVVVRTGNKTATELQDLLTGTRLMHLAAADIVDRFTQPLMTKSAYSQLAMMAGASNTSSLRNLREKYKSVFMLVDGCDYPNGNVKNCVAAFDQIGHGAIVCAGLSVLAAWTEDGNSSAFLAAAVDAVQRLKKNIQRYVAIL